MNGSGSAHARRDAAGAASDRQPIDVYPGTPRWVKIAGIVAIPVIILVSLMHLTGVAPSAHVVPVEHGVPQP